MDDALRRLGMRIRELRTRRGWSQEAFADVAGVHRTYMGHLERDEKNLSFLSTLRVANSLGVTPSELLAGLEKGESTKIAKLSHSAKFSNSWPLRGVLFFPRSGASMLGAVAEIVDDGRTGFHFRPGDPHDLARTIDRATNNPEALASMRLEARREYEAKFTADRNFDLLMAAYRKAIVEYGHGERAVTRDLPTSS